MVANIETIAYAYENARDIPWHKLGSRVPKDADTDTIVTAAGIDWEVELRDLYVHDRDYIDNERKVESHFAVVRKTDRRIFGVVGSKYTPVQNREAFEAVASWVQDGHFGWETAGALGNGSRVWGLGLLGEDRFVGGKDPIRPYLLIYFSHDGSGSVVIRDVATRVVCANTLGVALHEGRNREVRLRHTASVTERIKVANEALGLISKQQQATLEAFDRLAQLKATEELCKKTIDIILPKPEGEQTERQVNAYARAKAALQATWKTSPGVAFAGKDNRWGLFNLATEFIDHTQPRRGGDTSKGVAAIANRQLYTLEGAGRDQRQRVFKLLSETPA